MTLFGLPDSWSWTTLGEIADVVGGVTKDSKKQSDSGLPLVPYLRVANVQRGYLDLRNVASIRVSDSIREKLQLKPGDVLLNEGGDRDKLGRGWVWQGELPECIHQNHVFRARVVEDAIHPKLLAMFANECGRLWFEEHAAQSVNLASISLTRIKQLPVPIPPLPEQDEILTALEDHLSRLDAAASSMEASLARAKGLRKSLVVEAFAGRLVPQDPMSEPAEMLLERIRRERAALPKARRGRRSAVVPQEEALL